MSKILITNWKANPTTLDEALGLFDFYLSEMEKYQNIKLVVCPPFVYLEELAKRLQELQGASLLCKDAPCSLGAQDLFWEHSGPYTGEVSVDMLKNFGVTHVLVGHSDRRYKIGLPSTTLDESKVVLGESDEVINKKIKAALEAGITPVLLVGEKNREDDRKTVLEQQLAADLVGLTLNQISKILIAYEPVWAISTTPGAKADTPANTLEAIDLIKNYLITNYRLRITGQKFLYGGSVNKDNVEKFLRLPELSGAVIGGASLRKKEFARILKLVNNIK